MVSQPQNAIRSGIGINTGVAMGYKISKKWNFESGIRYLRGNSTLNSNTYAFQQNGYVNTFFADYLLQNSANQDMQFANTVVADASQFGNRYEYLMIPMQVGYEIGLSKKVALNILAGVSTDIFLQNTIINDNSIVQEKSTINTSSNIYKPLNLSGLGGVRASYLISKHWQLNLGSSYQHSLFSGINNSTALQMRLKMFGLNYGLNYRF
jgi:Outer membrane protein beta-barrel domain